MRWPFKSKRETDLRIYRDPKTDHITLRIVGPVTLPSEDAPIQFSLTVTMDYILTPEAVVKLYQQLSYFARPELDAERAGQKEST